MIRRKLAGFFRRLFTWKGALKALGIVIISVFVLAFGGLWYISNFLGIPEYQPIQSYRYLNPGDDNNECVNLDPETDRPEDKTEPRYQGWCDEQRQTWYRTPQGTDFFGLQYDWVANLERPMGKKQLMTREYMQAIGYVYDSRKQPNENNDLDLPVGLTWHRNETGDRILDVSCAACHSGQMTYKGTSIVVDGSPGGHALPALVPTQFVAYSAISVGTTYLNPFKFNRFAKKVLKDVPKAEYRAEKKRLRKAMWQTVKEVTTYARYNLPLNPFRTRLYPTEEGYGRTDGLGRIANTVYGDNMTPDNYRVANAPVNYPHVWDIWAFDWVQWMGSVRQAMARNVNEALGTRARLDLTSAETLYENSVMMPEVHCIETTLQHLQPPTWPADLFGAIDNELADQGETIFKETCQTCHGPFPRKAWTGDIDYEATKTEHKCTTCHGPFITSDDGDLMDLIRKDKHPLTALQPEMRDVDRLQYKKQDKRKEYWEMIHIPLDYIGTDPTSALNMINYNYDISSVYDLVAERQAQGGVLRVPPTCDANSEPAGCIDDPKNAPFAQGLEFLGGEVRYKQYREWDLLLEKGEPPMSDKHDTPGYSPRNEKMLEAVADLNGFGERDIPVPWRAYRPRPLEGIWATAPFLHNGSVPSIYQLLLPAEERDAVFYLGRKEFDPKNLGFVVDPFKGAFKFDTSITGNSNLGHEFDDGLCGDGVIGYQIKDRPGYCRQFTERERLAVIEYLKKHTDGKRPDPESKPHCLRSHWDDEPDLDKIHHATAQLEQPQ